MKKYADRIAITSMKKKKVKFPVHLCTNPASLTSLEFLSQPTWTNLLVIKTSVGTCLVYFCSFLTIPPLCKFEYLTLCTVSRYCIFLEVSSESLMFFVLLFREPFTHFAANTDKKEP